MTTGDIHREPDLIKFGNHDKFDADMVEKPAFGIRRTTIVATLANPDITLVDIEKIMEAGMNVARFLTSHSTSGDKIKLISKVDKAARFLANKYGMIEWPCATCIELKTCVVKTGIIEGDRPDILMKKGTEVTLTYDTTEIAKCNEHQIFVDNPYLISDVRIGMEISIQQETIILQVKEIGETTVKCVVIKEGNLVSMETVCMRGAQRTRPYLSKKDLVLVKLAVEYQVDMIIVNYVRHAQSIKEIKKYIGSYRRRPFIIAGVCTLEGLCNIDDIITEADGVMVSRELLAYELDRTLSVRMFRITKWIVGKCLQVGKPILISGQIFYNTLKSGRVEHQDVSDITNALLDGVSGFIFRSVDDIDKLIIAMKGLSDVCTQVEPFTNNKVDFERQLSDRSLPVNAAIAAAMSAVLLANEAQSRVMIIPTVSGHTVYHLNWLRPACLILAVTTNIRTFRLMQIFRSVIPLLYKGAPSHKWYKTVKARMDLAVEYAVDRNWLLYADYYVTLEKGAEESAYCDTVRMFKVTTKKRNNFRCSLASDPKADLLSVKTYTSV